ncbi:hypothetical protein PHSY_005771 [Pseudozyma hubeiensis SY62]|uniref:Sensitive to high expression protein 9, mitochondrial n=1 Tax=Pseudozyma hubeiensis (strain SY62) TaxID=1305764 RepID=R9PA99_PSEHS|nr:hypothetical protein PHSY_005771 [Pseudozyma hubeiensis SY62]GAC98182.1 hypothetical protein PHSY_005771 [Pseudozyma hubeiensis SY62]
MGPILATSVWRIAARAPTLAARAGPSTSTTAVPIISSASRWHTRIGKEDEWACRSYGSKARAPAQQSGPRRAVQCIAFGNRAFSAHSISRYADDVKGKNASDSTRIQHDEHNKQVEASDKQDVSSDTRDQAIEQSKAPEPSASSSSNPSSKPSSAASDTTPNTPSAMFDRLRNTPLPSFDGLTSSSSLSTTLSTLTDHTRTLISRLRSKISNLSTQYNTHTGYTAIETLKSRITLLETSLESARTLASAAKKAYLQSVQSRSTSQRETNDLLSRKNSWTESDLSRYTELLRKEHALSRQETEAEKELERSEAEVQACFDELMKAVMVRYHEEQIWSDRMRGMSTYGSLLVAGLNAVLFVLAILLVEPYKRRRLAETFEQRLVAAEEQSRRLILDSVEGFRGELRSFTSGIDPGHMEMDSPPLLPPPTDEMETVPAVEQDEATTPPTKQRYAREQEERLVFASTVGVVMGAALSLLISACWS